MITIEVTQEELDLVTKYRDGFRGVFWHIDDFEHKALENEDYYKSVIYDRTKFEDALDLMINKHDCTIGITWDTVDYYLEDYCRLEN